MDEAQKREDAAKVELRERAEKFVDVYLGATGSARDKLIEAQYGVLYTVYLMGATDGCENERGWHRQIGGCPR